MADGSDWGNDPIQSMSAMSKGDFGALMDKTFGKGKWRLTGGYRSPERENQLRAQGAETVSPGHTSAHSEGTEDAPGAYDVVVDGLSPAGVADRLQKSGQKFAKLFPEGASGTQGGHLHVQPLMTDNGDWGDDPIVEGSPKPGAPKPGKPPAAPKAAKPTPRQRALAEMSENQYVRAAKDFGHEFMEGARATDRVVKDAEARQAATDKRVLSGQARPTDFLPDVHALTDAARIGGNALASIVSPATGLLHTAVGRPVTAATNSERTGRVAEDVVGLAIPVAGEARAAADAAKLAREEGVSVKTAREILERRRATPLPSDNALKTVADDDHGARVRRLPEELRKHLTPGQIKGGEAKVAEQEETSSAYKGAAIREAHQESVRAFNRSMYDDALKEIGLRFKGKDVGDQAVDHVGSAIGAVYDRALPKAVLKPDKLLHERLAEKLEDADLLGPNEGAFKALIDKRVIKRLGVEKQMDGETFKTVESELSDAAHQARRKGDYDYARAIDDVQGALRENLARTSPPGVREELQKANRAWAKYKRITDAAARRPTSDGVFSTGDYLQAVKRGSSGDQFARGKALGQQVARDAHAVIGNVVPDSGTARRLNRTRSGVAGAVVGEMAGSALGHGPIGGAIGGAVGAAADRAAGGVTNQLAAALLRKQAAKELARRGMGASSPNALRSAVGRVATPPAAAALMGVNAVTRPNDQQP